MKIDLTVNDCHRYWTKWKDRATIFEFIVSEVLSNLLALEEKTANISS